MSTQPKSKLDLSIGAGFRPHTGPIDRVTHDDLERLSEVLEAANEQLSRNRSEATLEALRAVVTFLYACDPDGQLARPIELLSVELCGRTRTSRKQILPPEGASGVVANFPDKFIKAAAAFAVEMLHTHGGMTVKSAAVEIAEKLVSFDFPFGVTRKDARTVFAWRRDYRAAKPRPDIERIKWNAADFYCDLAEHPPLPLDGNLVLNRASIHRWLEEKLNEARYEPSSPY